MTDIRARLADALLSFTSRDGVYALTADDASRLADVLLSLPGIAIVDRDAFERLHYNDGHGWCAEDGAAWPCQSIALLVAPVQAQEEQ